MPSATMLSRDAIRRWIQRKGARLAAFVSLQWLVFQVLYGHPSSGPWKIEVALTNVVVTAYIFFA